MLSKSSNRNLIKFKIFYFLLILLFLQGCIYYTFESTPKEIIEYIHNEQKKGMVQNLFWYRGRKDRYDYFTYVYGMFAQRKFKVEIGKIKVLRVLKLTSDYTKWIAIKNLNNQCEFWTPQ